MCGTAYVDTLLYVEDSRSRLICEEIKSFYDPTAGEQSFKRARVVKHENA